MVTLCLSNFSVPSSVTYLRRFHPSSQPLFQQVVIEFLSRKKLLGTGLFSNTLPLVSWSEMCFKNLALALFFTFLINLHLFVFTGDLIKNLDEGCSSWTHLPLKILMMNNCHYLSHLMNVRHYHYLIHPRMNCIFSF